MTRAARRKLARLRTVAWWVGLVVCSGCSGSTSPSGNPTPARIYVADAGGNRIVRIDDMAGTNWTAFGTLGTGTNQFSGPTSVYVDAAGKIILGDGSNDRIVRMDDMSGTNWTAFGTPRG